MIQEQKRGNMTKGYQQRFSLSILLWMRQDKTRQAGMDYWSGGHA
ncbi:hypothetical protein [Streptococcus suis]|nr:hypothetical protein [Streptococcus suis]MDE1689905.1 hypothetical protein [Streptococcus suis]